MFGRRKRAARHAFSQLDALEQRVDLLLLNQGRLLAAQNRSNPSTKLRDHEFKVFSQWGEDGILQRLVSVIPIRHRTFIEFGVEDFREANCRFLLEKDDWRGCVLDGSAENISRLRSRPIFWRHHLSAEAAFITRENIQGLLEKSGFDHELGILSIDLDGNDYHILEALSSWRPCIIVIEYNAVFGRDRAITVPYDPTFSRWKAHYSGLFTGCSLGAAAHLADRMGYALVGTNSCGNNAFFVRRDLVNPQVEVLAVEEAFTDSLFHDSRAEDGSMSHLTGEARLAAIRGLPVLNVITGGMEPL